MGASIPASDLRVIRFKLRLAHDLKPFDFLGAERRHLRACARDSSSHGRPAECQALRENTLL